ncbi:MAG TPA: 3-hydroxyacyl-CoA dehydrogenase [Burkholderiaceae bacterium]|nr:3-hydroxyacyl-CoA dehydrogenase [Burkholderiaceae bacterium]
MSFDATSTDLRIAIVGTGAMGRGIAQIAAQAGITVLMHDALEGAAAKARDALAKTFDTLRQKGRMSDDAVQGAMARLQPVERLAQLADAALVIEAIVEDLDVKRALFVELEAIVAPGCVLATNTSSLSVTAIAAGCAKPERVVGFHFFNPVPLMKVVEVIDGVRGAPEVGDAMIALALRMGHEPVRAKDTPGFIVNHAGRGYGTEALRLQGENVAAPHVIDAVLREQAGFKLGPFELLDLTALDVSVPVMESIYHQYFEEPRFRPSPLAAQRRVAGLLGRKTGEGYYRYVDGRAVPVPPVEAPAARPASVWVSNARPALGERARELFAKLGVTAESGARPSEQALCFVTLLGDDVSQCCVREALHPARTVGLDMLFDNERHRSLILSPRTSPAARDAAHGLLASDQAGVSVLRDSAGAVAQRVVATIINIGCDIAQQGIAAPDDIDRAVTLGLGYPHGPLAWGDRLGAATVLEVLANLHALSGDPRYRASPWLRRRALLGMSLLAPEL